MTRWYEEVGNDSSNIISSRVRLTRNWEEYPFPSKLGDTEAREMILRIRRMLADLPERSGRKFIWRDLLNMEELDKMALRERRLFNQTLLEKKSPGGLLCSEDEKIGIFLNGDDHIRMQVILPGMNLQSCYAEADALDDYINEKLYYAFSDKYGYLTAYPTNVGTGMRASVTVHLPSLTASKRFQEFLSNMARFGTGVRGIYGRGTENIGDLYEVYNQKTLGMTEEEVLDLVGYVAGQLAEQERNIRNRMLDKRRLIREDEAYKAYGVLKYARKLSIKEAMIFLSHLRAGVEDGLLTLKEPVSIYDMMLAVQPAGLQCRAGRPMDKEELETARGQYVREHLPDLV